MNHLEKSIIDIIEKRYKRKYIGGIKVTKLGEGFRLVLDLQNAGKKPILIAAELNEEDFLKFVEQELITRLLLKVEFFRGIKIEPEYELRNSCQQN